MTGSSNLDKPHIPYRRASQLAPPSRRPRHCGGALRAAHGGEDAEPVNPRRGGGRAPEPAAAHQNVVGGAAPVHGYPKSHAVFSWPDSRGVPWRDVLRENARMEFEEARFEKDPEIVTRLLINGRDVVESALEKLADKQRREIEKERGGGGDGGGGFDKL
ncbi:unnamed protein product [Linum tenue]|uniref:Uncharacterized protein n=1 Tax=Linum tenue TaxID=586396 RepID=A0AAV0HC18_9ROSI|nr:unnamed protein product [Linum tenue]